MPIGLMIWIDPIKTCPIADVMPKGCKSVKRVRLLFVVCVGMEGEGRLGIGCCQKLPIQIRRWLLEEIGGWQNDG